MKRQKRQAEEKGFCLNSGLNSIQRKKTLATNYFLFKKKNTKRLFVCFKKGLFQEQAGLPLAAAQRIKSFCLTSKSGSFLFFERFFKEEEERFFFFLLVLLLLEVLFRKETNHFLFLKQAVLFFKNTACFKKKKKRKTRIKTFVYLFQEKKGLFQEQEENN